MPARGLWVVTKEDGTRYFYGGGIRQTREKTNTSTDNSIEWGVRWGHWIGPSNAVEGQEQFPVAWNLVCIENIWGDRITFTYEQDQQLVGTAGIAREKYTQACRLSQVIGATGEKIVFHYGSERGTENPYEKRQKWYTLPGGGPDAYQDRLEIHFLDSLNVFNAKGDLVSRVQFRYASLGTGEMQKQILKAITHTNSQGQPYAADQLFEYYGENSADGVSVSRTDSSKVAAGGALFGALKSVISPQGATISYQYAEISLPHARRDMEIPHPSGKWLHPRTYWGVDYVVVIWRGTGSKLGKLHVSAYQWSGRWIPAVGLAEVTIRDATGIIQVELSADFFAIVTPGQDQSLHLFSKNHLKSRKWIYAPQNTGSITDFLIASGTNFLVLLDKSNGRLRCYTQEGESWRSDPVFEQPLKTGAGTVFGLTARNYYVFTLSAVPDNAFKPEIRLYHLDQAHAWQRTIQSNADDFFPRQGSIIGSRLISVHIGVARPVPLVSKGVETMVLQGSNTFVVLQVSQGVNLKGVQTGTYHNYKHVVYTWTDDYATIKTNALGQEIEISSISAPADPQLIVADNMVIISSQEAGKKCGYHYLGSQWIQRDFANKVCDGNGKPVASTAQSWYVLQKDLTSQKRGYYVRLRKTRFSINDGSERVVEQIYPQPDDLASGFPVSTVTYNYDIAGREEKLETSSIYGWRMYLRLRERHILAEVVESTTRVNTIVTGASATHWHATPLAPFRLTPGGDLPPEFQGDGWSVTALETISAGDRHPFPPGTSQQPWKADISPLILTANLSGTLLFAYDCKVTVDSGWTWMQLEVWVDGQKVWNVAREQGYVSSLSDYVTIALPARHGRIEWRVNCGAHVLANEPSHLVHFGEVAVSIREIRFLLLAPGETYRAKNTMAVMGFPDHAIVMGEQDVDMPPSVPASAGQEAQAAWLKTSTIVARNPTYGVVTETRDVDTTVIPTAAAFRTKFTRC